MERKLFLLLCFIMLAVNCASAVADPDCWYEYQYGTHDYEQVDARKPTCTEDGYYLLECRQCGTNVRKITGNATGHSWKEVKSESYSPTCTENGVTTYACANCAKTRTESVKALGHDMRDEAVVRSPTCEIEGLMSIRCARCGLSDLRDMKRADHQYGEWRVITQATDHSAGERQRTCMECGKVRSESFFPEGTLMRGSSGEAVRDLQQMLMDMYILNDKADGVFGAKTETAVMAYQQQAGLGADGIVWPQTLDQLILDWQRAMGYAPAPSESPALRSVCRIYREANGAEYIQNCDYHRGIADMAAALPYATGDGNALRAYKQIRMLWQTELDTLYSEWIQSVPAAEQDAVIAAQATYTSYLTVYETVLQRQYDDEAAALHINSVLDRQCAMLCNVLHGEQ